MEEALIKRVMPHDEEAESSVMKQSWLPPS